MEGGGGVRQSIYVYIYLDDAVRGEGVEEAARIVDRQVHQLGLVVP